MRSLVSTAAIAALLAVASPAFADSDSGAGGSMQRAMLIARDFGVLGVHQVQYSDGKWEIEGRDPRGQAIRLDVDAATGAVLRVERDD